MNHSKKVEGHSRPGAHSYHSMPASAASRHTPKSISKSSKIQKVMHEFKHGGLHSGSKQGPKITSRKQAVAIAISEARQVKKK